MWKLSLSEERLVPFYTKDSDDGGGPAVVMILKSSSRFSILERWTTLRHIFRRHYGLTPTIRLRGRSLKS